MDEKTKMCVEKVLDLQLELAGLLEETAIDAKVSAMTVGRIRAIKDRIDFIRKVVAGDPSRHR